MITWKLSETLLIIAKPAREAKPSTTHSATPSVTSCVPAFSHQVVFAPWHVPPTSSPALASTSDFPTKNSYYALSNTHQLLSCIIKLTLFSPDCHHSRASPPQPPPRIWQPDAWTWQRHVLQLRPPCVAGSPGWQRVWQHRHSPRFPVKQSRVELGGEGVRLGPLCAAGFVRVAATNIRLTALISNQGLRLRVQGIGSSHLALLTCPTGCAYVWQQLALASLPC